MKEFLTRLEEIQHEFINTFGVEYKGEETDKMYLDFLFEEGVMESLEAAWNDDPIQSIDSRIDTCYVSAQFMFIKGLSTIEEIEDDKGIGRIQLILSMKDEPSIDLVLHRIINTSYYECSTLCNPLKALEIVHAANMRKASRDLTKAIQTVNNESFPCYIEAIGEDFSDKVLVKDPSDPSMSITEYSNYKHFVVKQSESAPMPHKVVKPIDWYGPEKELEELLNG